MRLERTNTLLTVIDVQEKLTAVVHDRQTLQANVARLVRGCHVLKIPAVLTEQYPEGLGQSTDTVKKAFDDTYATSPIQKTCFSSFGCADFAEQLQKVGRKQILIAGIETHVCVYQTVMDLLGNGYEVHVVADAVSSRTPENKAVGLQRMQSEGAKLTSTEMALFELTQSAGTDEFRAISKLIR